MYARAYRMFEQKNGHQKRKSKKHWRVPVFLFTLLSLGLVFSLLGYAGAKRRMTEEGMEEAAALMEESAAEQHTAGEQQVLTKEAEPVSGTVTDRISEKAAREESASMPQQAEAEAEAASDQVLLPSGESEEEKTKIMYLTFDDGPSAKYTEVILDVLAEYDIKATFFMVGENVEKNPELAKRVAQEGHTIGIHCYSHAYHDLYDSVEGYVADFEKAYDIIYETTGVEVKIFRFPGGSINAYNKGVYKDIITEMTERGFTYYDWNASLEDSVRKASVEELVKSAVDTAMNRERVILLAHDTIENTSLSIEDIILSFPEYQFAPLTEEVVPICFRSK